MDEALRKRQDVPLEHTWDAATIYSSDAAWEAAITQVKGQIKAAAAYKGRLGEKPAILADWLKEVEALVMEVYKILIYAGMFHHVDMTDQEATAKNSRAYGLMTQGIAAIAYGEPELLSIGFEVLDKWVQTEPRLAVYAHYFDELKKRQAHVRSAEVEEVLGQLTDAFQTTSSIHGILADADLTFSEMMPTAMTPTPAPITQGTITDLLTNPDREVRQQAWQKYADAYLAHKQAMAACLDAGIKQDVFKMRVRRYHSSLEAALAENFIPVEVFHNTINTFRQNLPLWHRYWRIRRQALGYDSLHLYDVVAPLTKQKPVVPFKTAVEWIEAGMQPLGEAYITAMQRGISEERWIDIYPNRGKRSGAFSSGSKGTPPFILMNYTDDMFSMSVLAHELGHSMHSYYTWNNQPLVYASYSIFVAEVASNFNQALVRAYLFDKYDDPDFQLALIEEAMANFYRYFFIMPTLARFELAIHEQVEKGGALTADWLTNLMADLFIEGYGDEVDIDRDRLGITWAQFPSHLYANFYVYQYTTGIAGAHALADDVLAGKNGSAERYLDFLKAGSSVYPLDVLKAAGVDMASPQPVEKTFAVLADMVDRLEKLVQDREPVTS